MADSQESSPQGSQPSPQDLSQESSPDSQSAQVDPLSAEYSNSGDDISAALDAAGFGESEDTAESSENAGEQRAEADPGKPHTEDIRSREESAPAPPLDKVKPSALATFHRQQKELFNREQAFKAKEAEYTRMMGIIENAKSDRLAALELMGYDNTKDFLQSIAEDGGRETPERKQIRELQAWKAEQEKQREEQQAKYQAEQEQKATQAKLDSIRAEVQNTLKSETYAQSLLGLAGSDENVMAEMDRMATETGEMPRIEDAIKNVEGKYRSYLEEMVTNPEVIKFFEEKLRQTKSVSNGAPQSKTRERTQTIDRGARSPGTRVKSGNEAEPTEDEVLAEAMAMLRTNVR